MKTSTIIFMAMAIVAVGMTSCEKNEKNTLSVSIKPLHSTGNTNKVSLGKTTWSEGDRININGSTSTVSIVGGKCVISVEGDGPFYAAYPYTISGSAGTYSLSASDLGGDVPMFAYAANTEEGSLSFSCPISILRVTIDNRTGQNLSSGTLTFSNANINMTDFTVEFSGRTPVASSGSGGTFTLPSVSASGSHTATMEEYILPNTGNRGTVAVNYTADDGVSIYTKTSSVRDQNFYGGFIYNLTIIIYPEDIEGGGGEW